MPLVMLPGGQSVKSELVRAVKKENSMYSGLQIVVSLDKEENVSIPAKDDEEAERILKEVHAALTPKRAIGTVVRR